MSEDPPQEGRARSTSGTPHRISPQSMRPRFVVNTGQSRLPDAFAVCPRLESTMNVIPSAAEESPFASRPTARYNYRGG
jgi:hypothetical protein